MTRALRPFVFAAVLLVAVFASAGPRPSGAVTVSGGGVAPVLFAADPGYARTLQCPGAAVWYRTVNAAEYADGGFGLVTAGSGMTDGGAFGVLADFRTNSDPIIISMSINQQPTEVGVALLGIDAGGSWPCYFSVP